MVSDNTHLQKLLACGGSHVTILIARELREGSRAELEGEEEYLLHNTPLNYVHPNFFKNYVADFIHISRQGLHEEHRY